MATTGIRWLFAQTLVAAIAADSRIGSAVVAPGWPGDKIATAETVYVGQMTGDLEIPVFQAGRKQRRDTFTVPVWIYVRGRQSLDDAGIRVAELVAVVEDALADDPNLSDLDGLDAAEVTSIQGPETVHLPEFIAGAALVTITAVARYV